MVNIKNKLNQKAVVWKVVGKDIYGAPGFGNPFEINIRWEDKQQKVIADQEEIISQAIIFCLAEENVTVGDWVWLGELLSLSSSEEGNPVDIAKQVKVIENCRKMDGTISYKKLWL